MTLDWQTAAFDDLTPAQLYAILQLRQNVFIIEQDCIYPDLDNLDAMATHMSAWRSNDIVAYQRCLPPGASYQESSIGRIVVAPAGRGLKLGRELVQRGIDYNRARWPNSNIQIGAQAHLQSFYGSLGFTPLGDEYIEDGIPHRHMLLDCAA
ncbi:MAG: GNAT family N-acetyltransferase [Halioglobus sp.]